MPGEEFLGLASPKALSPAGALPARRPEGGDARIWSGGIIISGGGRYRIETGRFAEGSDGWPERGGSSGHPVFSDWVAIPEVRLNTTGAVPGAAGIAGCPRAARSSIPPTRNMSSATGGDAMALHYGGASVGGSVGICPRCRGVLSVGDGHTAGHSRPGGAEVALPRFAGEVAEQFAAGNAADAGYPKSAKKLRRYRRLGDTRRRLDGVAVAIESAGGAPSAGAPEQRRRGGTCWHLTLTSG